MQHLGDSKYINSTLHLEVNEYSCGHETIYSCLNYCYLNKLKKEELYFLSEPYKFEQIENEMILGYNSLKDTNDSIRRNLEINIQRIEVKNYKKDILNIANEVLNSNLVILYLKTNALYYHNFEESRYPYHMVIVYGFDLKQKTFRIADLFVKDDYKTKKVELDVDAECFMKDTLEYLVIKKEDTILDFTEIRRKIVDNVFADMLTICKISPFYKIKLFFENLENSTDVEMRVNAIASFRWIIMYPLINNFINYSKRGNELQNIEILLNLLNEWEKMTLKYIKMCYKCETKNIYERLNIEELINRTRLYFQRVSDNLKER